MKNKKELKKFICPYCKADLKEVGLKNAQAGYKSFDCEIINDKGEIGNWEEDEFNATDSGEFYCPECREELDLEELGLSV